MLTTMKCIEELRSQAPASKERGFTEVLDANAAVFISDTAVDHGTKMALRSGVAPLENVRDTLKDWHPGSDGKVLDIVHPSLFPLMYGTSRFLREGTVPLKECAEYSGKGEIVPRAWKEDAPYGCSSKHQWLPCEVSLDDAGNASITSYINNLHPVGNEALYAAIEQVITKSVPMWKLALRSTLFQYERPRVHIQGDGYDHDTPEALRDARMKVVEDEWKKKKDEERQKKLEECQKKRSQNGSSKDEEGSDDEYDDDDEFDPDMHDDGSDRSDEDPYDDRYISLPDPDAFVHRERKASEEEATQFERMFAHKDLQVIVKLANIHLSPEKPSYDGGSWHIEVRPAGNI